MTPGQVERRRIVCARVLARMLEVAPQGAGRWEPAWCMVLPQVDDFLDALSAWLAHDTPGARDLLRVAAGRLVGAWRRAGETWVLAGRPGVEDDDYPTAEREALQEEGRHA